MIISLSQQPLSQHVKTSHPQLCPCRTRSHNISLAAGFKAMQILQNAFLLRSHRSCLTNSHFQTCSGQRLHGAGCLVHSVPGVTQPSPSRPVPSTLLQLCTQGLLHQHVSYALWPRDKKNAVDSDATVCKEIPDPLPKSGSASLQNKLGQFYLLSACF